MSNQLRLYRAWINQPSTQQELHSRHGQRCIVHDTGNGPCVDLYFTEGDTHSMRAHRGCVSRLYLSDAPSERQHG